MSSSATVFAISGAIYLAAVSSFHILKSEYLEPARKSVQLIITWGIPVIGPIIFIAYHLSDKDYIKQIEDMQSKTGVLGKVLMIFTLASFGGFGGVAGGVSDGGFSEGVGDAGGSDGVGGGDG